MKNVYILTYLIFILLSCNGQNNNYKYEDKVYKCFVKNSEDADFENKINDIEKILIKNGILKSEKAQSYIDFFTSLKDINDSSLLFSENIKIELKNFKNLPGNLFCHDKAILLDTVSLKKSRFYVISEAMVELFTEGGINKEHISSVATKYFTKEDFEHKLFKTIFIIKINNFIQNNELQYDWDIYRELPPYNVLKKVDVKERNLMKVFVNSKNEIYINDVKVLLEEINPKVKTFFLNPNNDIELPEKDEIELPIIGKIKVSKGIISIQTEEQTKFDKYLQVQDELVKTIMEIRDNFSIEHFNLPYNDLSYKKKVIVESIFPLSISEAEPRSMTDK